jgi:hypothetical protein
MIQRFGHAVWRIRNVYPGSDFFPSRILTVSIPDPGSLSKNLSILTPKKAKKWFLCSKKYDPGCSSRIPDPDADFLPSRIQGSKRHPIPDPGSGSATLGHGSEFSFTLDLGQLGKLDLNPHSELQVLATNFCGFGTSLEALSLTVECRPETDKK